jgi:hypothetical protein
MESCSDKFHIDIPNVLCARARCTYRLRMARCLIELFLIVAIVLIPLQRKIKNYHYRHRHYIVIHQQPLCAV